MEIAEIAGLRPDMLDREKVAPAIHKTVGILIFPSFELLDVYGPMDLCSNVNLVPAKLWGGLDKIVEIRLELWTEYEPHRDSSWDPFAEMAGLLN